MRERFRLHFAAYNWERPRYTEALILRELSKAHECIKWKQVPFYTNMVSSKYGPTIVYKCGSVYYILNEKLSCYSVATVARRWLAE